MSRQSGLEITAKDVKEIIDASNCIILDIEGTTTSLEFVQNTLFPYAEKNLELFVKTHWNENMMTEVVDLLNQEEDLLNQDEGFEPLSSISRDTEEFEGKVISRVRWLMKHDYKTTGLKKLQGYIWMSGYKSGLIKGHVYEDVPLALKKWKSLGKKIYIYSSGSVEAQKLLFSHSPMGNLDEFIDGNFDTTIGSKIESVSYLKIAREIGKIPENIVFITDRPKEVAAAKQSGFKVILMIRQLNNPFFTSEKEFLGKQDGNLDSFASILEEN